MLKVFTQNCFGTNIFTSNLRLKFIRDFIEVEQPDFVFLQEIIFKFQVDTITPNNYSAIFVSNGYLVDGGLLTLVRNDYQVLKSYFKRYSKQGKILSSQISDRILRKGFLDVEVDTDFHLINTHLLATYSKEFIYDKNQESQLIELYKYLKQFKNFILAGDFNFDEDSIFYKKLLKELDLNDLTYKMGNTSLTSARKLDIIFHSKPYKEIERNFVDYKAKKYPSDHKGIIVEFGE